MNPPCNSREGEHSPTITQVQRHMHSLNYGSVLLPPVHSRPPTLQPYSTRTPPDETIDNGDRVTQLQRVQVISQSSARSRTLSSPFFRSSFPLILSFLSLLSLLWTAAPLATASAVSLYKSTTNDQTHAQTPLSDSHHPMQLSSDILLIEQEVDGSLCFPGCGSRASCVGQFDAAMHLIQTACRCDSGWTDIGSLRAYDSHGSCEINLGAIRFLHALWLLMSFLLLLYSSRKFYQSMTVIRANLAKKLRAARQDKAQPVVENSVRRGPGLSMAPTHRRDRSRSDILINPVQNSVDLPAAAAIVTGISSMRARNRLTHVKPSFVTQNSFGGGKRVIHGVSSVQVTHSRGGSVALDGQSDAIDFAAVLRELRQPTPPINLDALNNSDNNHESTATSATSNAAQASNGGFSSPVSRRMQKTRVAEPSGLINGRLSTRPSASEKRDDTQNPLEPKAHESVIAPPSHAKFDDDDSKLQLQASDFDDDEDSKDISKMTAPTSPTVGAVGEIDAPLEPYSSHFRQSSNPVFAPSQQPSNTTTTMAAGFTPQQTATRTRIVPPDLAMSSREDSIASLGDVRHGMHPQRFAIVSSVNTEDSVSRKRPESGSTLRSPQRGQTLVLLEKSLVAASTEAKASSKLTPPPPPALPPTIPAPSPASTSSNTATNSTSPRTSTDGLDMMMDHSGLEAGVFVRAESNPETEASKQHAAASILQHSTRDLPPRDRHIVELSTHGENTMIKPGMKTRMSFTNDAAVDPTTTEAQRLKSHYQSNTMMSESAALDGAIDLGASIDLAASIGTRVYVHRNSAHFITRSSMSQNEPASSPDNAGANNASNAAARPNLQVRLSLLPSPRNRGTAESAPSEGSVLAATPLLSPSQDDRQLQQSNSARNPSSAPMASPSATPLSTLMNAAHFNPNGVTAVPMQPLDDTATVPNPALLQQSSRPASRTSYILSPSVKQIGFAGQHSHSNSREGSIIINASHNTPPIAGAPGPAQGSTTVDQGDVKLPPTPQGVVKNTAEPSPSSRIRRLSNPSIVLQPRRKNSGINLTGSSPSSSMSGAAGVHAPNLSVLAMLNQAAATAAAASNNNSSHSNAGSTAGSMNASPRIVNRDPMPPPSPQMLATAERPSQISNPIIIRKDTAFHSPMLSHASTPANVPDKPAWVLGLSNQRSRRAGNTLPSVGEVDPSGLASIPNVSHSTTVVAAPTPPPVAPVTAAEPQPKRLPVGGSLSMASEVVPIFSSRYWLECAKHISFQYSLGAVIVAILQVAHIIVQSCTDYDSAAPFSTTLPRTIGYDAFLTISYAISFAIFMLMTHLFFGSHLKLAYSMVGLRGATSAPFAQNSSAMDIIPRDGQAPLKPTTTMTPRTSIINNDDASALVEKLSNMPATSARSNNLLFHRITQEKEAMYIKCYMAFHCVVTISLILSLTGVLATGNGAHFQLFTRTCFVGAVVAIVNFAFFSSIFSISLKSLAAAGTNSLNLKQFSERKSVEFRLQVLLWTNRIASAIAALICISLCTVHEVRQQGAPYLLPLLSIVLSCIIGTRLWSLNWKVKAASPASVAQATTASTIDSPAFPKPGSGADLPAFGSTIQGLSSFKFRLARNQTMLPSTAAAVAAAVASAAGVPASDATRDNNADLGSFRAAPAIHRVHSLPSPNLRDESLSSRAPI